ncbi:hypothetical protein AWW72_09950 [Acinetobacter sp. NRRL B-65365]|jgi:hypothetical protein|uniref:hypothetical protein n=1 Tax=Acinetobacter sp. NRRL B-65365 TaxID=1785092 RepID=UPI0007A0A16F|nr:hypothetical protein [Acinetobacter sp. NRRL B-65365]KYQ84314.1 hypothetical protein AWW72_09950 [Acinetobacter sp. NRRL B-65365]
MDDLANSEKNDEMIITNSAHLGLLQSHYSSIANLQQRVASGLFLSRLRFAMLVNEIRGRKAT